MAFNKFILRISLRLVLIFTAMLVLSLVIGQQARLFTVLGVGLILMRTAWHVVRPAWSQLTDASLAEGDVAAIVDVLKGFSGEYIDIHDVRTRSAGAEWHVDFHLVVRPETTVLAAHELCDRIEEAVESRFPEAVLNIHVEPRAEAVAGVPGSQNVHMKRGQGELGSVEPPPSTPE